MHGMQLAVLQVSAHATLCNLRACAGKGRMAASLDVDQTQINRLFLNLVRIGEKYGVQFPREFSLFIKQLLYFDRYTRILAPSLQVRICL